MNQKELEHLSKIGCIASTLQLCKTVMMLDGKSAEEYIAILDKMSQHQNHRLDTLEDIMMFYGAYAFLNDLSANVAEVMMLNLSDAAEKISYNTKVRDMNVG